jgi:AraC-like DNA-binding protein
MNELYNILSIFITGGLFFAYGIIFLFAPVSGSPLLGNYRKARYAMAGAYLFFVIVEVVEYLFGNPVGYSVSVLQTVTLATSVSQAFLFTFAILALMEVRFPGWKYIFREAAFILLYLLAVIAAYAFCSVTCFGIAFYGFAGIYALILARYTFLFIGRYRQLRYRLDNYYSDEEAGRLRWIVFSFFAALSIGITALLTSVFMSTLAALIFTVIFDIFYTFFAIRFINYPHLFKTEIEQVVAGETMEEAQADSSPEPCNSAFVLLEKRIERWIGEKGFIEQGITINTLAAKLITNSKYLSVYINTYKKMTFRKWINELRIEEAKRLLIEEPKTALANIAFALGFSDKSHFLRQFREHTGMSPTEWKAKKSKTG